LCALCCLPSLSLVQQRFWNSLQELQKLLDAAYPGALHTHVKGHRYLSVDTLASLSVASPAVKVGTLRRVRRVPHPLRSHYVRNIEECAKTGAAEVCKG